MSVNVVSYSTPDFVFEAFQRICDRLGDLPAAAGAVPAAGGQRGSVCTGGGAVQASA